MSGKKQKLICRIVIGAAVFIYFATLAIAVIGTQGLFGVAPDGLSAVFLIFVGLPWSLAVTPIALLGLPVIIGQVLIVLLPLLNIWILHRLCRGAKE